MGSYGLDPEAMEQIEDKFYRAIDDFEKQLNCRVDFVKEDVIPSEEITNYIFVYDLINSDFFEVEFEGFFKVLIDDNVNSEWSYDIKIFAELKLRVDNVVVNENEGIYAEYDNGKWVVDEWDII